LRQPRPSNASFPLEQRLNRSAGHAPSRAVDSQQLRWPHVDYARSPAPPVILRVVLRSMNRFEFELQIGTHNRDPGDGSRTLSLPLHPPQLSEQQCGEKKCRFSARRASTWCPPECRDLTKALIGNHSTLSMLNPRQRAGSTRSNSRDPCLRAPAIPFQRGRRSNEQDAIELMDAVRDAFRSTHPAEGTPHGKAHLAKNPTAAEELLSQAQRHRRS